MFRFPVPRLLPAALRLVVLASPVLAQMQCQVEATPGIGRREGVAELLPDLVLRCAGGTPATAGSQIPRFQVLVTATAPLTSRPAEILTPLSKKWTEGLLLVGDPPEPAQRPCVPVTGETACPAPPDPASQPNVFQAQALLDNIAMFDQVLINPPGQGTQTVRITNLRVDLASLTLARQTAEVGVSVVVFAAGGVRIPVKQFERPVLTAQPALQFSVRTFADRPLAAGVPALRIAPLQIPRVGTPITGQTPAELDPILANTFHVKFTEAFPGAFRRRSIGTSSRDPAFLSNQSIPGAGYQTESGFFNTHFGIRNALDTAGVADSGTRLMVVFEDVPAGVDVYVSKRDVSPGTSHYEPATPRALLTIGGLSGGGPYSPPNDRTYVRLSPIPNVGVAAVWEIVGASADEIEEFSFSVALAAPALAPSLGKARAYGFAGPIGAVFKDPLIGIPVEPLKKRLLYLDSLREFKEASVPRFAALEEPLPLAAFEVTNVIATPGFNVLSGASFSGSRVARGSIAAGFGDALANSALSTGNALGTSLLGTAIEIVDSTGRGRMAPLFLVSPAQINFYIDPDTAVGPAVANVIRSGAVVASGQFVVDRVAPALFTANGSGSGPPAGDLLRIQIGFRFVEPLAGFDEALQTWQPRPVQFGSEDELLVLILYGTGFRGRSSLSEVTASIGGIPVEVTFAGPQPDFAGLDRINLGPLPRQLMNRGAATLTITVNGQAANSVLLDFHQASQ